MNKNFVDFLDDEKVKRIEMEGLFEEKRETNIK